MVEEIKRLQLELKHGFDSCGFDDDYYIENK